MNDPGLIRLYDSSFQSQHAAKCDVLLRVDNKRLQFAIIDQLQDQLRVIFDKPIERSVLEELTELFGNEPFLKFHYRKIKVSLTSREFVFIPSEVYADKMLPAYASFIQSGEEVKVTHLRSSRIKNVVGLNKDLVAKTVHKFINPVFFSQADPVIEAVMKHYFKPIGSQLFLQFNMDTFEAVLFEGKKIKFYNTYDKRSADELNYFLLLMIRELNLDPYGIPVIVAGTIEQGDAYFQRIIKYFQQPIFADINKLIHISPAFSELDTHRFFSLLGINLCE